MLLSTRQGGNSYVDGVYYNAYGYFASVEKRFGGDRHNLALTILGAPTERGAQQASTQEAYDLFDFESGYSFAAELLPESLTVNGIPFQLGEKDAANGMTCNGDTIVLPEGKKYNKLYFLAAAIGGLTKKEAEQLIVEKLKPYISSEKC